MAEPGSKRILVVEDEPLVAMLLEDMLVDLGFEVVGPALRIEKALALAQSERLDAAVLDVNLGGHRSDAVAEVLQARGVPFLFATGYGAGDGAMNDTAVIGKPFRQSEVRAALEGLLAPHA